MASTNVPIGAAVFTALDSAHQRGSDAGRGSDTAASTGLDAGGDQTVVSDQIPTVTKPIAEPVELVRISRTVFDAGQVFVRTVPKPHQKSAPP